MVLFRDRYRVESARQQTHDYSLPGWYHVTICVADMKCALGTIRDGQMQLSAIGRVAQDQLERVPLHYSAVRLDEYSVMPNHVHALLEFTDDQRLQQPRSRNVRQGDLGALVGAYKAGVTRWCKQNKMGFAWQARFYDSVLRSGAAIRGVQQYIRENVINWKEDEFHRQ